ncbi:MAG: DNA polymerase III subunit beta [Campylobacterales bacterium]|nr:DNA polymerase III subunit beta [Campylobacterales bacterium]
MKLTVNKTVFEQMLSNVSSFTEKKDNSQITSHVYIEAKDGKLTIKGTDNEIGLQISTEDTNIAEEGFATANAKKITDYVRNLKDEDVTVEYADNNITIKQRGSKLKMPTFDAKEFPKFPEYEHLPRIGINSIKLLNAFKRISPAIDTNNPKYELNGALLDIKIGGVNIVSTDTKRLSIVQLDEQNKDELSIIIPKKAIQEMGKLFFDEIDMFYSQNYLVIRTKQYLFFTKLINGKFPDYHRILPKEFKYSEKLQKDKMIEAIKQISNISNEVKMSFLKDKILFESLSEENMEAKTEIDFASNVDSEYQIAFNSRFMLDFLSSIDAKEFSANFNEANMPFELKSDNFITIVMPIFL